MGPPSKIVQTPTELIFLYASGNVFRVIPIDGRPHDPIKSQDTTWYGDAVGKWDGDKMVIDIVGFTALVDELDCVVVRALQRDYFSIVSDVVRAGGGVVEKYVGDAVMAVFGTGPDGFGPESAASAVRVGLSVQEALTAGCFISAMADAFMMKSFTDSL